MQAPGSRLSKEILRKYDGWPSGSVVGRVGVVAGRHAERDHRDGEDVPVGGVTDDDSGEVRAGRSGA